MQYLYSKIDSLTHSVNKVIYILIKDYTEINETEAKCPEVKASVENQGLCTTNLQDCNIYGDFNERKNILDIESGSESEICEYNQRIKRKRLQ